MPSFARLSFLFRGKADRGGWLWLWFPAFEADQFRRLGISAPKVYRCSLIASDAPTAAARAAAVWRGAAVARRGSLATRVSAERVGPAAGAEAAAPASA